jgi:uncharacterized membrane protein YheB (UPF0754 family)
MNKSLITNLIALAITLISIIYELDTLYYVGVFSLAGAVTNWIAIHMLFEKVPGLYGSGVIPARFEEFKLGIKNMIMEQFFNQENLQKFIAGDASGSSINLAPVIEKINFEPTFNGLIEVIEQSSFGAMLEMVGGSAALEPMREPFIEKIKQSTIETTQTQEFKLLLSKELGSRGDVKQLIVKVENILEQRLAELTPQLVKEIVKRMIKEHLGWLVVWGGVFGGLIGALASLV